MKYYSVLDVSPIKKDWIPYYLPTANKLVAKYGGKYIARTLNHEQIEGSSNKVDLRIIIEWPSKQATIDFMNDSEYIPHLKARTKGSISNHYLIEGIDEFC